MRQSKAHFFKLGFSLCGIFIGCLQQNVSYPKELSRPQSVSTILTAHRVNEIVEPVITVSWAAPSDSLNKVSSYTVLRSVLDTARVGFEVIFSGIPDSIFSISDPVKPLGYPLRDSKAVVYKVFAFDTLGRSSDTSYADTFFLGTKAEFFNLSDTLVKDTILWHMLGLTIPYTASLIVLDSFRIVYESQRIKSGYIEPYVPELFSAVVPDSLFKSTKQKLLLGLWIRTLAGDFRESLVLRSFYVVR